MNRMTAVELAPLGKTIEVRRSAEDAFRLFTQEINGWWPLASHSRAKSEDGERTERVDFEVHLGGRIYETLNTGEERDWGEVLALEPGRRVLFSFEMGRPQDQAGEVDVRFDPIDAETTRVTLTHSHWERYGDEAPVMRGRFSEGWDDVFVEGFGGFVGRL